MGRDEIIEKQINLIGDLKSIGRSQQSSIDSIGRLAICNDLEDHKRAIVLNAQKLYIENYWNYVDFFIEKLKNEKDNNFQFYVPLIRTLLEIYIELLFLSNQDRDKQSLLCISNHLYTLAKNIQSANNNPSANKKELKELISCYDNFYQSVKNLIKINSIPANPLKLSKGILEKNNLTFPAKEEILKPKKKYFVTCSTVTRKLFKAVRPDNIYTIYRRYSDYVHANIYSLMKIDKSNVNEKYWIIVELQLISILMIELCNKKITGNSRKNALDDWIKNSEKDRFNFSWHWLNKKFGVIK